jgi:hypothetical protein
MPGLLRFDVLQWQRRRKAARRELVDTGRDKRFVRRGKRGRFKESDDVDRS